MAKLLQLMKKTLGEHLLLTNTVTCSSLFAAGDAISQFILKEEGEKFDLVQTGRYAMFGAFLGPVTHGWYKILDRALPAVTKASVFKKVLLDQTIAGPFFICAFFMGMGAIERRSVLENWNTTKRNFWPVYKVDLAIWPLAQAVNFTFVPSHLRVVYVALVTLCWNTFLAWYRTCVIRQLHPEEHEHASGSSTVKTNLVHPVKTSCTQSMDRLPTFVFKQSYSSRNPSQPTPEGDLDLSSACCAWQDFRCCQPGDTGQGLASLSIDCNSADDGKICTGTLLNCVDQCQYIQSAYAFLTFDKNEVGHLTQKNNVSSQKSGQLHLRIRNIISQRRL